MIAEKMLILTAIAARTGIVYLVLIAGLRITGKRQSGEMDLPDLMLVLMLGNSVQNAMTQGLGDMSVALVAAGALILVGWLYETFTTAHPAWEKVLTGVPTVIVENGRADRLAMRRQGITNAELMSAVRHQGLAKLDDVKLAVLEVDGEISIVPNRPPAGGSTS